MQASQRSARAGTRSTATFCQLDVTRRTQQSELVCKMAALWCAMTRPRMHLWHCVLLVLCGFVDGALLLLVTKQPASYQCHDSRDRIVCEQAHKKMHNQKISAYCM